jgi:hypothetical protein
MNMSSSLSKLSWKDKKMPKFVKILLVLLIVVLLGGAIYLALDRAGFLRTFKMAMEIQQQEQLDKNVLDNLKKIILLPEGINPTMAVINNIDVLKKQQAAFFSNAKNGDRVLIYPNMAIIYDYQANKIIQVGPVQTEPLPADQQGTAANASSTGTTQKTATADNTKPASNSNTAVAPAQK